MTVKRQFYVYKFNSSWLREHKFKVKIDFENAMEERKIISIADNQMLRLIREISHHDVDLNELEFLYQQRDKIKRQSRNKENGNKIRLLQKHIYDTMFIPEYVVVVIESDKDYDHMFDKGLFINDKKYIRASCSSAQGRTSRVVFVEESTANILLEKLENGRNKQVPFSPSKYNAYLGMSNSSTDIVSTPKFCVIPDCLVKRDVKVWWVTEDPDKNKDDVITKEIKEIEFNLFDGNGLISPKKAKEWAEELRLDYVPAQWCVRASWIKGMLSVFDFHKFCEEENGGNYVIKTSYKDNKGQYIYTDLRDVDVILTESQFKLWDSYSSLYSYSLSCKVNHLDWGVSLYTPKQDKDILELNYQFVQTLNLDKEKVEKLCGQTVDYLKGVSYDNYWYTMLFLLGSNLTQEKLSKFMQGETENYWLKVLLANPNLLKDSFIKNKVKRLIRVKMQNSCLGKLLVDGNFQVIVPDSFAFMEHALGKKVKGIIKPGHFYSNYWNLKEINKIDCMRAPLTYLSEHLVVNLQDDEKLRKWFGLYYTGIITNIYDEYTLRFAGSDFDYDIIATTSNDVMIENTYDDLPVKYDPPKPAKMLFTQKDLQTADKFTFGSIIGQITNNATMIRTMMADFEENSPEYRVLINRMRMACKMQSAQIDKAKIGKKVKGIPGIWRTIDKPKEGDSAEVITQKKFYDSILCRKHPYFFIYLYKDTMKKYREWKVKYKDSCRIKFGISLDELMALKEKSQEQIEFLKRRELACPVIDNNSIMNMVCHHMEGVIQDINYEVKKQSENVTDLYKTAGVPFDKETYARVLGKIKESRKHIKEIRRDIKFRKKILYPEELNMIKNHHEYLLHQLYGICSNKQELVNYLVDIFYKEYPSYNKELLFSLCGKELFENVLQNSNYEYSYPVLDEQGDTCFQGKKYSIISKKQNVDKLVE